jgi:tetratricopeptide (TPR) repeat protein
MAGNGKYRHRAVGPIAVFVLFSAIGLTALPRWEPLKRGLARWTRHTGDLETSATASYEQGNWKRAADLSRQSLKTKGDDPKLLRVYARASARLGRDGVAAAVFDRLGTSRLEPEDFFLLGLTFARAGNLNRAFEIWNEATQSGPDYPEMLDHLARLAARMQRLDEAAVAARKLQLQPGWEARGLLILGEIQLLLKNPDGAAEAIRKGLELDPSAKGLPVSPHHFRKLLARSWLEIGQPARAIETLSAEPGKIDSVLIDPEASWLLSRAYLQNGRSSDAFAALKRSGAFRDENPLVPEPSPFTGAARCASCHPKETMTHNRSRHSRTLHRGPALLELPFPDKPLADPDDPKVTHTFKRDRNQIQVETRAGDRVFETVVEYAFGVREGYVTMIGRDEEKNYRALRLSSYHTAEGIAWGPTSGDVPDSDAVEDVRGQPIPVRDGVVRCIYCHVTNFRDYRDPPPASGVGPTVADSGIGCERCHGPGGNHLAAIKAGFPDRAIVNAGTASSSAITVQCADCHVVGSTPAINAAPDDPMFVRSPGLTLTFSRCYTESNGELSCLTCHDPHRDDEEPVSFYEKRCLTCHSQNNAAQTACRVNPSTNCLNCHMPKIAVLVLHSSLTDHFIRVRKNQ